MERPAKMQKIRHPSNEEIIATDFQPFLFTTADSYGGALVSTADIPITYPMTTGIGLSIPHTMSSDQFNLNGLGCGNGFDFSFAMDGYTMPFYTTPPMTEMPPPSTLYSKGTYSPPQPMYPPSPSQQTFLSPASQSGVWTQSKKRSFSTPARSITPATELMAPSSPLTSRPSTSHSHSSFESPSPTTSTPNTSFRPVGSIGTFLPKVQQILTRLLCDIRYQREQQSKSTDQTYHQNHSKDLFPLVLSLWTNLRSLCNLRWTGKEGELIGNDVEARDSTLTLGFLAISIVLEMYKSIAISSRRDLMSSAVKIKKEQQPEQTKTKQSLQKQKQKTISASPTITAATGTTAKSTPNTNTTTTKTYMTSVSPVLDSIVRLTVMECHLVGLEQVFEKLDSIKSCRELLPSCNVSVTDFQSLRIIVTGIVDDWKKRL